MQRTFICLSCGAELLPEARFCRNCGQPARQVEPNSVTEGTTRLLETPERQAPPFAQNFYEHHGSLAQATSPIPPQVNPTSRSLEPKRIATNWVLIGAVSFAILALVALLIIRSTKRSGTTVPPPVIARPEIPAIPQPPAPPAPPRNLPKGGTIGREFIYPGSETTMEINGVSDGNVLQLHTTDPFDRVVDWYTEKLRPTNTVKMKGSNVILESGEMTAIINAVDDGTTIMLTQGGDD
jgi:hypothetical protein